MRFLSLLREPGAYLFAKCCQVLSLNFIYFALLSFAIKEDSAFIMAVELPPDLLSSIEQTPTVYQDFDYLQFPMIHTAI
jgi:hypothetical protein